MICGRRKCKLDCMAVLVLIYVITFRNVLSALKHSQFTSNNRRPKIYGSYMLSHEASPFYAKVVRWSEGGYFMMYGGAILSEFTVITHTDATPLEGDEFRFKHEFAARVLYGDGKDKLLVKYKTDEMLSRMCRTMDVERKHFLFGLQLALIMLPDSLYLGRPRAKSIDVLKRSPLISEPLFVTGNGRTATAFRIKRIRGGYMFLVEEVEFAHELKPNYNYAAVGENAEREIVNACFGDLGAPSVLNYAKAGEALSGIVVSFLAPVGGAYCEEGYTLFSDLSYQSDFISNFVLISGRAYVATIAGNYPTEC